MLELCLTFRLRLSLVVLLLHGGVKGLFGCWYAVVEPWAVLAWLVCWKPVKPSGFGLVVLCPLGYV